MRLSCIQGFETGVLRIGFEAVWRQSLRQAIFGQRNANGFPIRRFQARRRRCSGESRSESLPTTKCTCRLMRTNTCR